MGDPSCHRTTLAGFAAAVAVVEIVIPRIAAELSIHAKGVATRPRPLDDGDGNCAPSEDNADGPTTDAIGSRGPSAAVYAVAGVATRNPFADDA